MCTAAWWLWCRCRCRCCCFLSSRCCCCRLVPGRLCCCRCLSCAFKVGRIRIPIQQVVQVLHEAWQHVVACRAHIQHLQTWCMRVWVGPRVWVGLRVWVGPRVWVRPRVWAWALSQIYQIPGGCGMVVCSTQQPTSHSVIKSSVWQSQVPMHACVCGAGRGYCTARRLECINTHPDILLLAHAADDVEICLVTGVYNNLRHLTQAALARQHVTHL